MAGGPPEPDLTAVVIARAALRSVAQISGDLAANPDHLPRDVTWRRLIQLVNTCDLDGRAVFGGSALGRAYGDAGNYLGRSADGSGNKDPAVIPDGVAIFGSPPTDLFTTVSQVLRDAPHTPGDLMSLRAHVDRLWQIVAALERRIEVAAGDADRDIDRVLRPASITRARAALDQTVPRSLVAFLADS
jgi:hypothetical protein